MKKIKTQNIFFLLSVFLFLPVFFASADLVNPLGTGVDNVQSIICLIISLLSTKLMPPLAVLFIIWAGFLYLTAAGKEENIRKANSTIVAVSIGIAVLILAPALVAVVVSLSGTPADPTSASPVCSVNASVGNMKEAFVNLINWFSWFIAAVSVMMGLYSGFLYMTSAGDPKKAAEASKVFVFTLIGIVVSILAFGIVSVVEGLIK
ncbi:TrbC/VirB2 family protein [Candidatus Azambacteria bacterium]|nr:TrbC/VirB2 family protein [Candidatus Azambacteria bacterium]